ncbi:hypothetical protein OH76DRAFT_187330 [Lentinus brumalis]|uniref:Uncharacterized protein n=1 Tax=Lentinus brumalis TaxID=2498619 RepID=A0A371CN11_9APHY|nr:hypothetical protein OH76DRAFT_187330 [Polyporus brumalis]
MEFYTCALLRRQNSGNYHFVTYARCTPEDTIGNAEKKLLADYYNPLCSAFEAEPADSLELYGLMYDIKPDLTESPRQSKERYRVVNDTFLDNYAGGRLPKMLTLKEFKAEYDCEFLGVARVESLRRTPYYPQEIGTALDVHEYCSYPCVDVVPWMRDPRQLSVPSA